MLEPLTLMFQFLIGHAVADFVMQNGPMGAGKNRHNNLREQHGKNFPPWYYWMTAHALIHGGAVYIITQNIYLGLLETALHWMIDFSKCEGWINIHVDQGLHVLCKIIYTVLIVYVGIQ